MGINVIIDLDLTDLFFSLYRHNEYFQINQYNQKRYKEYIIQKLEQQGEKIYGNPIYGFYTEDTSKL